MPRFKDRAICIRDLDWSETSQVVVLLTAEHGKVRGLAKGSKRQSPSSVARFSGGIELLTAGEVLATTRPTSDLAAITEWDLQDSCYFLRRDLPAQGLAMYAADLCNAMLADLDPHPQAFALLGEFLGQLQAATAEENPAAARAGGLLMFQWNLLVDLGYRPELYADVRTGEPLLEARTYSFDPVAGGLTLEKGLADWRVRAETVRTLRHVAEDRRGADEELATLQRANRLLCVYFRALLDKELPTMRLVLQSAKPMI